MSNHAEQLLLRSVECILAELRLLTERVKNMASAVDDLVAQVAAQKTVIDSTVTLLNKLTLLLQGAINTGDMAKVQAVVDDLKAQDKALADAVTANTPTT